MWKLKKWLSSLSLMKLNKEENKRWEIADGEKEWSPTISNI